MTLILGLETSCDETSASVVEDGIVVRSNVVATQHDLHQRYSGVVPEIASRAHLERLMPTVREAAERAGVTFDELDAIAVGNRPGLVGSLIVGASAAKALAWSLGKPIIGIDHVQAHLYASCMHDLETPAPRTPAFPALGLVVSGGHTSLYRIDGPLAQTRLGRTIDDAIGEAYDKAAVMLKAGYPGGPKLDQLAQQGDPSHHDLPRSLLGPGSLDFSFSGLKTALLYKIRGKPVATPDGPVFERAVEDLSDQERADFAASFQAAAVGVVITKLRRALKQLRREGVEIRDLILGGGVTANSLLRESMAKFEQDTGVAVHLPAMAYCLDNAAMIAGLAHHRLAAGEVDDLSLPVIATSKA